MQKAVEMTAKAIVILYVMISVVVIVEIHVIRTVFLDVHQAVNQVAMLHVIQLLKAEILHNINRRK